MSCSSLFPRIDIKTNSNRKFWRGDCGLILGSVTLWMRPSSCDGACREASCNSSNQVLYTFTLAVAATWHLPIISNDNKSYNFVIEFATLDKEINGTPRQNLHNFHYSPYWYNIKTDNVSQINGAQNHSLDIDNVWD